MRFSKTQLHRRTASLHGLAIPTGSKYLIHAVLSLIFLWASLVNAQHSGFDLHATLVPLPSSYLSDWQIYPEVVRLNLANNTPSPSSYRLQVEIRGATHGFVASGESPLMHLQPFTQSTIFGPEMIDWNNIQYNGALRSQILQTGRIPEDDYELCVTALSPEGNELARFCTPFQTRHSEPITLIAPANGDSITVPALTFLWTPQPSTHERPAQYELQIVEVLPGQTPQEAMASNFAYFKSAPLETSFLTLDNITFEEGKNYAWQVRQFYGDGGLSTSDENASEIWTFVIEPTILIATPLATCDCGAISLDMITPFKPEYNTQNDTDVMIKFKVDGSMKCTAGTWPNECTGALKWELVGKATWWATNQLDAKKAKVDPLPGETQNGDKSVTAPCGEKRKPTPVSAEFEYKVTLPGVRPINGIIEIKLMADCPNGKGSSRKLKFEVDSDNKPSGFDPDASDFDGDGLNGSQEKKHKTNPYKQDSDGDRYSDDVEIDEKSDPNSRNSEPKDSDKDGYTDKQEKAAGTDPNDPNSHP